MKYTESVIEENKILQSKWISCGISRLLSQIVSQVRSQARIEVLYENALGMPNREWRPRGTAMELATWHLWKLTTLGCITKGETRGWCNETQFCISKSNNSYLVEFMSATGPNFDLLELQIHRQSSNVASTPSWWNVKLDVCAPLKVIPRTNTFLACGPNEKCVPPTSIVHSSHSMTTFSEFMNIGPFLAFSVTPGHILKIDSSS
jgi:hypothetical protein